MNEKKNHRDRLFRLMTAALALWLVCWGISLAMEPYRTLCSPWLYAFLPVTMLFLCALMLLAPAERTAEEDVDQIIALLSLPALLLLSGIWAIEELSRHTSWGPFLVGLLRLAAAITAGVQILKLIRLYRSEKPEKPWFSPELLWKNSKSVLILFLCLLALIPIDETERVENWQVLNGYTGEVSALNENIQRLEEELNADGENTYCFLVDRATASPAGSVMDVILEQNGTQILSVTWFRSCSQLTRLGVELSAMRVVVDPRWNALAGESHPLYHTVADDGEHWLLTDGSGIITLRFPQELTPEQRTELLSFFGPDAA